MCKMKNTSNSGNWYFKLILRLTWSAVSYTNATLNLFIFEAKQDMQYIQYTLLYELYVWNERAEFSLLVVILKPKLKM